MANADYKVKFQVWTIILGSTHIVLAYQISQYPIVLKKHSTPINKSIQRSYMAIKMVKRLKGIQNCRDPTTVSFPHGTKPPLSSKIPKLYCHIAFCNFSHVESNLVFIARKISHKICSKYHRIFYLRIIQRKRYIR